MENEELSFDDVIEQIASEPTPPSEPLTEYTDEEIQQLEQQYHNAVLCQQYDYFKTMQNLLNDGYN